MKIFGIGLGRTGTWSLTKALEILGYTAVHYPHRVSQLAEYDAATDETLAAWYPALYTMYPDARYIYTFRPVDTWLDSWKRVIAVKPEETHPITRQTWISLYGQEDFDPEVWESRWLDHYLKAKQFFEGKSDQFLEISITEGEGWEKLCPFLDKPLVEAPFPHANAGLTRM